MDPEAVAQMSALKEKNSALESKVDELTALWSSFVDGESKQDLLAIDPVRISVVIDSG